MVNEMKNKSELILNNKNIMKSILVLALPIMFSNILKSIHDIVDMYFVANLNIDEELVNAMVSAITVTNPIIAICQALATGFMIAGAAIMSQYLGAGKAEKACKVSGQLLSLCIIVGIVFNIALYFTTPYILQLMGAMDKPLVYEYAKEYVMIRSFELTGLFTFFAYQATRQSMGDTTSPVILNVGSVIINIILTALLVNTFYLKGAAYATVIANMIIIPICLFLMFKTEHLDMRLHGVDLKWNKHYAKKIFRLGMPAALAQAFTSLGFLIINTFVLGFESHIISGIGVGGRINSLLLFPAMAIGTILATFVGQNVGAKNITRARESVRAAMVISLLITGIGALILMFLREPLARIFLKDNDLAVESCVHYLYFLLIGLPLMGIFQIFIGTFQGAGRTDFGLILSSVRLWILRIPVIWLYIHVQQIGEASVWYAMVISNFGASILGTILYQFVDFKPRITKMNKRLMKNLEGEIENGREYQKIS